MSDTERSIPLSDSNNSSALPSLHRPSSTMVEEFEPGSDTRDDVSQHGSIHHALSQEFEDSLEHYPPEHKPDKSVDGEEHATEGYQRYEYSSSLKSPEIDQPTSLLDSSSPQRLHEQNTSHHGHQHEPNSPGFDTSHMPNVNNTVLEEEEMRRKLKDYESSFLKEPSTLEVQRLGEQDGSEHSIDMPEHSTYLQTAEHKDTEHTQAIGDEEFASQALAEEYDHHSPKLHNARSFTTGGFQTPSLEREEEYAQDSAHPHTVFHPTHQEQSPQHQNTSSLERMSSPPALAPTLSRAQSLGSMGGYETAAEEEEPESPTLHVKSTRRKSFEDAEETPRRNDGVGALSGDLSTGLTGAHNISRAHSLSLRPLKNDPTQSAPTISVYDPNPANVDTRRRRPVYLTKRSSSARLSYDSTVSTASDSTLGVDYGLMTGGRLPDSKLRRRPNLPMTLSRSTSVGSMAGLSGTMTDEEDGGIAMSSSKRAVSGVPSLQEPELSTLVEESPTLQRIGHVSHNDSAANITPRASRANLDLPSDSTITKHVRDIEVPGTIARQFRAEHQFKNGLGATFDLSPAKSIGTATMTPGPIRRTGAGSGGLTLKEHRSKVDQLAKENFDLKMKCHFLDEALRKRSDEGIQDIIRENVQLKTDRLRLEKDNYGMKRELKDLQNRLQELESEKHQKEEDQGYASDDEREPTMEEELIYLRQRIEISEEEVERLRRDNLESEGERRRLAEVVRHMALDNGGSRNGPSEIGSREERDMWKEMLEQENIRNDQLRAENDRLAKDNEHLRLGNNRPRSTLRVIGGQVVPVGSSPSGSVIDRSETQTMNGQDVAELSRLRHENGELQKTNAAQIQSLASRNKQNEMLCQEIETIKLKLRHGSTAGDSILDRSASRARSDSRTSDRTRITKLSEGERETWEARTNELRDEISHLKLDCQRFQNERDQAVADFEAVDAQAQADADQFNEELGALVAERDNALREADEQDAAFQQLKNEAQNEIDGLGDELDAKTDECDHLKQELQLKSQSSSQLEAEVRSMTEAVLRLEQDSQEKLAMAASARQELEDRQRDFASVVDREREARDKVERLTVQMESSRNEIAFLREEQDSDKIKISDLESLLKKTHLNLDAERDRAKDLDRRLNDERHQREAVANHEKAEVQRIVNDLNREASSAKNDLRTIKKALSAREVEINTFRERLTQLEEGIRHGLRMPEGTNHGQFISTVSKMNKDLGLTLQDLERTRRALSEHKSLLQERDNLLENSALERRRLDELLERERIGRRQDANSFEQSLKNHEQASRLANASNQRVAELEVAKQKHRAQIQHVEAQYKEQIAERNQALLGIWRKLSAMCGPDWTHNNSLINGNLPSQEVIGNTLFWPGFSRNLHLAITQVEGVIAGFRDKIRGVERDLNRNYAALQKSFEAQNKKLDRIEDGWERVKARERESESVVGSNFSSKTMTPEMKKMRKENKLLRAELDLLQKQYSESGAHIRSLEGVADRLSGVRPKTAYDTVNLDRGQGVVRTNISNNDGASSVSKASRSNSVTSARAGSGFGFTIGNPGTALAAQATHSDRSTSNSTREDVQQGLAVPQAFAHYPVNGNFAVPPVQNASDPDDMVTVVRHVHNGTTSLRVDEQVYIRRQRELERRLKEEREGRVVDRDGMRQRLLQRDNEMAELKRQLQREKSINAANNPAQDQVNNDSQKHLVAALSAISLPRTRSRGGDSVRSGQSNREGSPTKKLAKVPRSEYQGGLLIGDEPIDPAQSSGSSSHPSGLTLKQMLQTSADSPQYVSHRDVKQSLGLDGTSASPSYKQPSHDPLAQTSPDDLDLTEDERLMAQGGGLGYRHRITNASPAGTPPQSSKKYPPSAPVRSQSYENSVASRTASRSSNEMQTSGQKKRNSGISESVRNKLINRLSGSHKFKTQQMGLQEAVENGSGNGYNGSSENVSGMRRIFGGRTASGMVIGEQG